MDECCGRLRGALAGVLLACALPALGQEMPQEQAQIEALLAADQFEQAYASLQQWRSRFEGQLWYDALLGRAAVKSGRNAEAIEILGHVLELHPEHDPSRFYLALAYAQSGDNAAAMQQYAWLADNAATPAGREQARGAISLLNGGDRSTSMPPTTPDAIAAMERQRKREHNWNASLFVATGYDTNASASSQDERFLVFQFNQANPDSETSFISMGGNFTHRTYDAEPWVWRNSIGGGHRINPSAHDFDVDAVNAQSEVAWKSEHWLYASALSYGRTLLDGSFNDSTLGWLNRAEHLTEHALYGIGLQYAAVRYDDAFARQDVDSWLLDISASTPDDQDDRWKLSLSPFAGIESAREANSPFGRNLAGLRGSVAYEWRDNIDLSLSAGTMVSHYDEDPAGAAETRKDKRYNGGVGLSWRPAAFEHWVVSTGVSYVRNQSNALGFDYNRLLASVELTRNWGD
jgi:hypothetical protein